MSGEDFIYSAITDDNVSAFDLNLIANTLASTDKLVRESNQLREENERLRVKMSSFGESALQITGLYESEKAKTARAEAQLASYVSQCQELKQRCVAAENDRVNTDLQLKERIAEFDRQTERDEARYRALVSDLVRYCSVCETGGEGTGGGTSIRWKDLRLHAGTVEKLDLPDEVRAFFHQNGHPAGNAASRSKRRKQRPEMCDQQCQTIASDDNASTAARMQDCAPNTDEPYPDLRRPPTPPPLPPPAPPPSPSVERKTFCDKGTMHSTMSTITRSTCTSAFIKRVDVGVNFPEVTHKSVDEILRECTRLVPLLLSPIADMASPPDEPVAPSCQQCSVETQTDVPDSPLEVSSPNAPSVAVVQKAPLVSCGTMTTLKNIRKRIDYQRKGDGASTAAAAAAATTASPWPGGSSVQQQYISWAEQLYAKKIKKEEQQQMASQHPLGGFELDDDTFGHMHPHLSVIWSLLGETIFSLMGGPGRRFDGQCYSAINEQLSTIRGLIEADGRRESELMSAMFSNVRATFEAAAGYGKERSAAGFAVRLPTGNQNPPADPDPEPAPPAACFPVDDCLPTGPVDDSIDDQCQTQLPAQPDRERPLAETIVLPSGQTQTTKETDVVAVGVESISTNSTITSAQLEQPSPPQDTSLQTEKGPKTDVARSKDIVDAIVATTSSQSPSFVASKTCNNVTHGVTLGDGENDQIAEELRLMEAGEDSIPTSSPMSPLSGDGDNSAPISIEDVLSGPASASPESRSPVLVQQSPADQCPLERIAEQLTPPERPATLLSPLGLNSSNSTSSSSSSSSSTSTSTSTATFVSPIKVKETNDLVKDQFKTPTQLPISKRKLRIRRSNEPSISYTTPPKRQRLSSTGSHSNNSSCSSPDAVSLEESGRLSPTTEFLLEDDWDRKLSSIKASIFCTTDRPRPLSPIDDRIEPELEVPVPMSPPWDGPSIEEEEDSAPPRTEERRDHVTLVENEKSVETTPAIIGRIGNGNSIGEELPNREKAPTVDAAAMEVDGVLVARHPSGPVVTKALEVKTDISAAVKSSKSSVEEIVPLEVTPPPASVPSGGDSTTECIVAQEAVHKDKEPSSGMGTLTGNPKEEEKRNDDNALVIADACQFESPESPDCDSPMSPPAHETGSTDTNSNTETISSDPMYSSFDSPLSPPPANPVDITLSEPPRFIPLDHVNLYRQRQRRRGPLELAIECYNLERRFAVVNTTAGRWNPQEKRSLQQLGEVVQRYLKCAWTDAAVAEAIGQCVTITQDGRLIAHALLESVISHADIVVNVDYSPLAPAIPVTQQKLVLLVRHLTPRLVHEPFDRVMLRELDRRLFQLKSDPNLSTAALIALNFLYIGLEDSKPPTLVPWHRTYSVRLYLFKCLYYFGFKCLPLVYHVLRAFPFALPRKSSPNYDNADAMISTIRTILMNINYTEVGGGGPDAALFKKRDLFKLLTCHYGYQPGSPTYEELVVNLIEKIRANRLRNVPHALILVAKRKGYEWARQHIIQKRLYPLLNDYLKLLDLMSSGGAVGPGPVSVMGSAGGCDTAAGLDERIVTCIYTLSSIMKTHPADEDVSGVMQIFTTIVQLARGHQAIEEEAIAGLLKFGRFGQAEIFERVQQWRPTYPVSDRIKLMLSTLLHRKDLRFWMQLIHNRIV